MYKLAKFPGAAKLLGSLSTLIGLFSGVISILEQCADSGYVGYIAFIFSLLSIGTAVSLFLVGGFWLPWMLATAISPLITGFTDMLKNAAGCKG